MSTSPPDAGEAEPRREARKHRFTKREITLCLMIGVSILVVAIASLLVCPCAPAAQKTADLFVAHTMSAPLRSYRTAMGEYPSTAEGLRALLVAPPGKEARWQGPYIEGDRVPLDPWGLPYRYAYPGIHDKEGYDLWSSGPDKISGTKDDIGNWLEKSGPTRAVSEVRTGAHFLFSR